MQQTFRVPDVHCDHCVNSIEGALGQLNGVQAASVDLKAKAVTVDFDESALATDDLIATIESVGYEVATA